MDATSGRCLRLAKAPGPPWARRLTAGTDTPLCVGILSFKAPHRVRAVSSHCLVMLWSGMGLWNGVLPARPHHPTPASRQQVQQSGCCHLHLQCLPACECCIVNGPLLTALFSADQQGSINERPLTIRSQLWLSERCTVCPSNTQLHLPDNCVIRVCINNWSTNRDMYYSPVCLIC